MVKSYKRFKVPSSLDKTTTVTAPEAQPNPLQYPLRPRAKGAYPKKSTLLPPSDLLGLYSLGAVIVPIHF